MLRKAIWMFVLTAVLLAISATAAFAATAMTKPQLGTLTPAVSTGAPVLRVKWDVSSSPDHSFKKNFVYSHDGSCNKGESAAYSSPAY